MLIWTIETKAAGKPACQDAAGIALRCDLFALYDRDLIAVTFLDVLWNEMRHHGASLASPKGYC